MPPPPSSSSKLLRAARHKLLEEPPKRIVISGPSGFLGRRVLDSLVQVHVERSRHGVKPGDIILLSSSPGNLMRRVQKRYGLNAIKTIRASRVDYYSQHSVDMWHDHLGSLGLGGTDSVFVNLAGVAGPVKGREDAMRDVNYVAPIAAAESCMRLGFGHWIQSSTQAVKAERGGQVPYSRWNAMIDFGLSRATENLPVTIAFLGLLYAADEGSIGQGRAKALNLADLVRFPLCPILGNGVAPQQPQDVRDAADRVAYLALTDPNERPLQLDTSISLDVSPVEEHILDNVEHVVATDPFLQASSGLVSPMVAATSPISGIMAPTDWNYGGVPPPRTGLRTYDAVGPESVSMYELMERLAKYQNSTYRPVFMDYRPMERLLNIKPMGNLNRQFVSLLRSEQTSDNPKVGNPDVWEKLFGEDEKLTTMEEAFRTPSSLQRNPYLPLLIWSLTTPSVIPTGLKFLYYLCNNWLKQGTKNPFIEQKF